MRGIFGSTTLILLNIAAGLVPIQLIGVIMATGTFWGLVFDAFVVKVKVTRTMVLLAVLTFVGVILVVNPAFILSYFGIEYS